MIIFTGVSDSPESLAFDILGEADDSYATKIREANTNSFAQLLMENNGYYAPISPVWIPGFSSLDDNVPLREKIIFDLDYIPSIGRANLFRLQSNAAVDINQLIGGAKCIRAFNQDNSQSSTEGGREGSNEFVKKLAKETTNRAAERLSEPAEEFTHSMHNLNIKLKDLIAVRKTGNHTAIINARAAYQESYRTATTTLNTKARFYAKRLHHKSRKYLISAKHSELIAQKKGIFIDSLKDVRRIQTIAKYGSYVGKGLFAFGIASNAVKVHNTYEKGGDWDAEAVGVAAETLAVYAAGEFLLTFTPVGWVALAVAAIAEGLILTGLGTVIDKLSEDAYDWCKKELSHWL